MNDERHSASRPRVEVCPDCSPGVTRRDFIRAVGGVVAAGAVGLPAAGRLSASPFAAEGKSSETWVKTFHDSLTEEQRKFMHFGFDHPLRSKISNNWDIVNPDVGAIGKFYTPDQQEVLGQIFRGIVTEDGYERFQKQMNDDAGGFDKYTCALFGKPGEKFEFVLTGRHLTLRVDGNSVENAAFGGPIFYGHAVEFNEKPDHPGNVWWHQARLANEIFKALDGEQREKALQPKVPADNAKVIELRPRGATIPGLAGEELSADQKELLERTLKSLLGMFRKSDVDEALACIKKNGGLEALRMAFYADEDIGSDGIWDCWRVEGPSFVWHFRGSPHIHVWVNLLHEPPRVALL